MYYFQEYLKKEKPAYMPMIRMTESINLCPEFFTDEFKAAMDLSLTGTYLHLRHLY